MTVFLMLAGFVLIMGASLSGGILVQDATGIPEAIMIPVAGAAGLGICYGVLKLLELCERNRRARPRWLPEP